MTQIMTPSKTMTAGQIDKAVANYRALLEKYSGDFNTNAVQTVLGQSELAGEQFAVFRRRVEAVSIFTVRKVLVNRNRSQQEALDATNRAQYTDRKVVDEMPKGEGNEIEVVFFLPDLSQRYHNCISDDDLGQEFELRGLKPADPISVAAVNEVDPDFADEHPNATHWKDSGNNWCNITFDCIDGIRDVGVEREDVDWLRGRWFAGVHK